ncbi:helix-turn-helix domain-containing protein [Aquisalimonas lutea]|uniref:helix-turn-helix transcriptional regulator n=1 Tax=Aquisalimonas lutea TaxID=1327750 RepID=UPI0025B41098|nr:helix-turn-helix domain-containing protein [Aquisalimonas lutea]MDN3517053.1 helix-turn-helix domain-containing protein [Aquisalimonas lutea]
MSEARRHTRLITANRAAELLGVTTNWLYVLRKRGDGPKWTRIGQRHVRYYEESVLRYRDRGARPSPVGARLRRLGVLYLHQLHRKRTGRWFMCLLSGRDER